MRILLTIKNFDFGGAENHVCELANSLNQKGNDVFIFGNTGRQTKRLNKTVSFHPCRLRSAFFLLNLFQLITVIYRNKIQIIHAHQRYAIQLSSIAGFITNTPVVITVHGRSQYDLRSWFSRRFSKKIIFVSAFVMRYSKRFPSIQHKIIHIPNGIEIQERKSNRQAFHISYVSRIDKRHSTVLLLMIREVLPKLLTDYPDITFNVIGEGVVLPIVQQEANLLNLKFQREICNFYGFRPEVSEIIQDAALVMGVGRVATEALACGTPVLSINKKRLGALVSVENYPFYQANNFVATGQPEPEAETLVLLLRDYFSRPDFWQKETDILQRQVIQDFSCEKIAERIGGLYEEFVNS